MSYYAFKGLIPMVYLTAFVHPSAALVGDVIVKVGIYIDPFTPLYGDYGQLIMQTGANIQDGCITHGYCDTDTTAGENGHIRYGTILHGCLVGRDTLVGVNSMIMDGAIIGRENIVTAMSFVKAGFHGKKRQLLMDTPARAVCSASDDESHWKRLDTKEYQDFIGCCYVSLHEMQSLRQMEENRPRLRETTDVTLKR